MFTLGCDRAYLYAHPERELTAEESRRYENALAERARGIPTQYITGHQEFWGMDFIVSPAVLIPRPETEHVIEKVLSYVGRAPLQLCSGQHSPANPLRVVDVGTGSGCIAVALAKELPNAEIRATDISDSALEVARTNADRNELDNRIEFHHTDLLQGFEPASFDFIVSNPPYVGESEEDQVQLEVRKFEPRNAVFAGPTGLEIIARLIPRSFCTQAKRLANNGSQRNNCGRSKGFVVRLERSSDHKRSPGIPASGLSKKTVSCRKTDGARALEL